MFKSKLWGFGKSQNDGRRLKLEVLIPGTQEKSIASKKLLNETQT